MRSTFQIYVTFAHAPLAVFSVTYHKTLLNSFTYHYLFSCAAKRKGLIESRLMFSCQPCAHLRGVGKIRHLESEFKNVWTFSGVKWISLVILLLNGFVFVHHAISYPLFKPVTLTKTHCALLKSLNAEFLDSVYVTGEDTVSFLIVFCVSISVFHLDDR